MWNKFTSWHCVLPPNRPPSYLEKIIHTLASSLHGKSALVLGSTPEYRSIVYHHGMRITVVEKDEQFYKSTSWMLPVKIVEETIIDDWFNVLPQLRHSFDLVLTHFTLGNVSLEKQDLLQELIATCVRPGGFLVDRVLHYRNGLCSTDDIDSNFRGRPFTLQAANDLNCYGVFRNPVVAEFGFVDASACYAALIEQFPYLFPLIDMTRKFVSPDGAQWSYTGAYRKPSVVYAKHFQKIHEIPDAEMAYAGAASTLVGCRLS